MQSQQREIVNEEIRGNKEVVLTLLAAPHPLFVDQRVVENKDRVIIESVPKEGSYTWEKVMSLSTEEKLRHLINLGEVSLDRNLEDMIYTYTLSPDDLAVTRNGVPLFMMRGIKEMCPPYESVSQERFIDQFKAMVIATLDTKASYEHLVTGQLPFYKGKDFCELIVREASLPIILDLLREEYEAEKEKNKRLYQRVKKRSIKRLWLMTGVSVVAALLAIGGGVYSATTARDRVSSAKRTESYQKMLATVRLAFINKDYAKVVDSAKHADIKHLGKDDKYLIAYSVIQTLSLTDAQKKAATISRDSKEELLNYWIMLGQSNIDEAINIASYLDNDTLSLLALSKKVNQIKADPDLDSEERRRQLDETERQMEDIREKKDGKNRRQS